MTRKQFMIDCETTGVGPQNDDILQIAALELTLDSKGFWKAGRQFNFFQGSTKTPESEFAKKHQERLYGYCNTIPFVDPAMVRAELLQFLETCGAVGMGVSLAGHNLMSLDIPFLTAKGYLQPPGFKIIDGKDVRVGDYHYRTFDLNTAISFVSDYTGIPRDEVSKQARELNPLDLKLEHLKAHDALYDCYSQTYFLNGLNLFLRTKEGK